MMTTMTMMRMTETMMTIVNDLTEKRMKSCSQNRRPDVSRGSVRNRSESYPQNVEGEYEEEGDDHCYRDDCCYLTRGRAMIMSEEDDDADYRMKSSIVIGDSMMMTTMTMKGRSDDDWREVNMQKGDRDEMTRSGKERCPEIGRGLARSRSPSQDDGSILQVGRRKAKRGTDCRN